MKIISLIGAKQSGKDTICDFLLNEDIVDKRVAFADPLKIICSTVFNIPLEHFHDNSKKEEPFKEPIELNPVNLTKCFQEGVKVNPKILNGKTYIFNDLEGFRCKTIRELLQIIGTDFFRKIIKDDFHLEAAFNSLENKYSYCSTDTRFINEFHFLKENSSNFQPFYVYRPKSENKLLDDISKGVSHPSESFVLDIKRIILTEYGKSNIINNDGTIDELYKNLRKVFNIE